MMASSITLPEFELPLPESLADAEREYDDDEGYEDADGEYDEGEDLDAEAEAMARRLGDQLLADIAKAQAEAAAAVTVAPASQASTTIPEHVPQQLPSKRQEAALLTMKGILALAAKHAIVRTTISATHVPGTEGGNLLEVFNRCISVSIVSKPLARGLSEAVLTLAKSDALFGSLRNSDAPALQLDMGKRKRDQVDEGGRCPEPAQKRIAYAIPVDQPDLLGQISKALRVITNALTTMSPTPSHGYSIDPAVISSIQLQLHQVFLFAVTSAPRAGYGRVEALQELAGLVQMLGVLSGIHIGHPPPQWHVLPGGALPPPPPDIGTAVYPCLVPGCPKTFHRLYSLRTHQRLHTLEHRPHRCTQCPASFVRNHDLKRHALLHDKKAWKCAGCNKIFSRRDAIKRHKDARGRGAGKNRSGDTDTVVDTACAYAEIETVEIDKIEGEEAISRRAKLWDGIVAASAGDTMAEHMGPEEGEVDPGIVHEAQNMVLGIHGLLQGEVAKGLGTPAAPVPIPPSHVGQPATLASIIARAQQSAVPVADVSNDPPSDPTTDMEVDGPVPTAEETAPALAEHPSTTPSLSLSWLSDEQTRLLEQAIAQASAAAQAQAEAEAALEEEEDFDEDEDEQQERIEKE